MGTNSKESFSCLAVDLGAESGRVAAVIFEDGRLSLEVLHRFGHAPRQMNGGLHWDIEGIWQGILTGLAKAKDLKQAPVSVGVDCWAVDYALVDAKGALLREPFAYRDPRNARAMQALLPRLGADKLYARTGIQLQPFNTLFQAHAHAAEHPLDLAKADKLLLLPDYLHYRLCGQAVCERTNASTTQLVNLNARNWDADLAKEAGLPLRLLQALREPGTLLGPLRPELAESLGLPGLQVVLPATHDTASAVAAVPAGSGKDWAYLSSGTWSLLGLELDAPVATPEAFKANFTNEGGVDGSIRFLKNIPGLWVLQQLRQERAPELGYPELMAMAETAPSLRCLFDAGHPDLLNPESMARTVVKLCRARGGKEPLDLAGLLRTSLESLALEYRHAKEQCEALSGRRLKRLHIVGGGSQNSLLCQMAANATGLEVLAGPAEASSLGNGLMQARGLGRMGSLAEARALVAASFPPLRYVPQMSDDWERAWARYQSLKEQNHA